jgi:hypothetical protein
MKGVALVWDILQYWKTIVTLRSAKHRHSSLVAPL